MWDLWKSFNIGIYSIIFETNFVNCHFFQIYCLVDHHYKTQLETSDTLANVKIVWCSFRVITLEWEARGNFKFCILLMRLIKQIYFKIYGKHYCFKVWIHWSTLLHDPPTTTWQNNRVVKCWAAKTRVSRFNPYEGNDWHLNVTNEKFSEFGEFIKSLKHNLGSIWRSSL